MQKGTDTRWSRDELYHRHHLSHQQIDDYLGERESGKYSDLKGQLLGKVHDFLEVSKILKDAGINFIPLKGPILSQRLYGDPSYRYFSDLDFLIDPATIKDALKVLLKYGYEPVHYQWPERPGKEKLLISRDNQYNLEHPAKNIGIELHWRPFHYTICTESHLNSIIASNLEEIEYAGQSLKVFNSELEAIYLIIHGGLHTWSWLKWLVDVRQIIDRAPPDPDRFKQLCAELNAGRMVALCNALLEEHFPGTPLLPLEGKVSKKRLKYALQAIRSENDTPSGISARINNALNYKVWCFPGLKYKWSLIQYLLYSSGQLHGSRLKTSVFIDILRRIIK